MHHWIRRSRGCAGLVLIGSLAGACSSSGGSRDATASEAAPDAQIDQCPLDRLAPDQSSKVDSTPPSVRVLFQTSMGSITVELNKQLAPITVENFLSYVDAKFYDGTIFHRVIANFMIQGGGYDTSFHRKTTQAAIKNEANNGLSNDRGTIAMARTSAINSATAPIGTCRACRASI